MKMPLRIVATGGLGSGCIYRLEQNHDLTREESRPAHRLPSKDACKQQIILHYMARMLRRTAHPPGIHAIGAVGKDSAGEAVLREMAENGIETSGIRTDEDHPTLFSVCWQFPDGAGGNLTESRSASHKVTTADITRHAEPVLREHGRSTLVIAAPEVPLSARRELLRLGRAHGALTSASFVSSELIDGQCEEILPLVDVLAINHDEAAALLRAKPGRTGAELLHDVVECLGPHPEKRIIWLTLGCEGAWVWTHGKAEYVPAIPVAALNTAGAGDASFAGLLSGIAMGFPVLGSPRSAGKMGALFGAFSVMSIDTLRYDFSRTGLAAFAGEHGMEEWEGTL
jgi:sugar/nucleoside kinase (ribokinase family)